MRLEPVDRRILGAIRFLDATTNLQVLEPLTVAAAGVRLVRNRRGDYVIFTAPDLAAHTEALAAPPSAPAMGSVLIELNIQDPGGEYLPRRQTIRLPRDPDPQHAAQADSLFRPAPVRLFPAPTARTSPGWAVVRATLNQTGTDQKLAGALIRVLRQSDGVLLARGLSDSRGEALVAVPGIPITTWNEGAGAVLASEIDVNLQVVFDPAASGFPDPDDLETRQAGLPSSSTPVKLASGRMLAKALSVVLP